MQLFQEIIKQGNLEALEEWIYENRSLRAVDKNGRRGKSALELSVKTGFYSMVKLLLKDCLWSEEELEKSLDVALWDRRADLVKLLLEFKAPIENISFYSVFRTMNIDLIKLFIDRGMNPCQDNGFSEVLDEIRAKPLLRFYKEFREQFPALEDQITIALNNAIKSKNIRWISLLIWAGADVRRKFPIDYEDEEGLELDNTPLGSLISIGDIDLIFKLKIKLSDQEKLYMLRHASFNLKLSLIKKLLSSISSEVLNSGKFGSCDALLSLVEKEYWDVGWRYGYRKDTKEEEEAKMLNIIELLLQAGAKWLPGHSAIRDSRRRVLTHNNEYIVRMVRLLLYTVGSSKIECIWELCRTDTMRTKIKITDAPLWKDIVTLSFNANIKGVTKHAGRR